MFQGYLGCLEIKQKKKKKTTLQQLPKSMKKPLFPVNPYSSTKKKEKKRKIHLQSFLIVLNIQRNTGTILRLWKSIEYV